MVAVALAAVLLYCGILIRRRAHFLDLLEEYEAEHRVHMSDYSEFAEAAAENQEVLNRLQTGDYKNFNDLDPERALIPNAPLSDIIRRTQTYAAVCQTYASQEARLVDYYAKMKTKYERAASRPWINVEPDTPPPPSAFSSP